MASPASAVVLPMQNAGCPCVDGRTGAQWLKAAIAYCNFRAGDAWRSLSNPVQRTDECRWWYLGGARLLLSVLHAPPARPPLQVAYSPTPSIAELEIARLFTRPELVTRLMAANPRLTDRRILMGFTRAKLARLIVEADADAPVRLEARRA